MPRPRRVHLEGALYYVTVRGEPGVPLFPDPKDLICYRELLAEYEIQHGFKLHGFALTADHLHLCLEQGPTSTISQIMHDLNSRYTKVYAKRYQRTGHLFQGRFRAVVLEKAPYLPRLTRFIQTHSRALATSQPNDDASALAVIPEEREEMRMLLKQPVVGSPEFLARVKAQAAGKAEETVKTGMEEEVPVPRVRPAVRPILSVGLSLLLGVGLMASWGTFQVAVHPEQAGRSPSTGSGRTAGASKGAVIEGTTSASPVQLTQGAPVVAPTPQLTLSHTEWEIQLAPMALKGAAPIHDRLRFEQGEFNSDWLSSQGFPKTNCTVTILPEGNLRWETMQTHPNGETVFWKGEWDGTQMRGIMSRRPAAGPSQDYLFRGITQGQDQKPSSTSQTGRTL